MDAQTPDSSGVMTPAEVELSLLRLAPDAIACIERTLRGTIRPNKAQVDCAWRVISLAESQEKEGVSSQDVDALANVLQLVNP